MPEVIRIEWPDELRRIAREGIAGEYDRMQLRDAAKAMERLKIGKDGAIADRESYVQALTRYKESIDASFREATDDLGKAIGWAFGDGKLLDEVAQMAVGYIEARHKEIDQLRQSLLHLARLVDSGDPGAKAEARRVLEGEVLEGEQGESP